jgi:cytochrome c oxidase subunit III
MSGVAGFADREEGRGWREDGAREIAERWHLREVGLWMFLGTLVMLFAAFSSALVVRKSSGDWIEIHLPLVMWVNTAVLVFSSATLEWGRRAGLAAPKTARWSIVATCVLGAVFFTGQVEAWRQLSAAGVFLPTSPSASFLYVLTGVHAVHLVAALASVTYLLGRTIRASRAAEWSFLAGAVSTFWHFLTGVWVYLLLLLQLA